MFNTALDGNLAPIINSAVEMVRPLLEERKHEIVVSLSSGTLQLEADPLRLEQILVNLLTNAAKYTEAGGRITLSASNGDEHIHIKISDTGMGISSELLPKIFDLFMQGDRTIARSEGGLGIGLTLVHKLTEMHGGSITAASEGVGKGSLFTVRLPALPQAKNKSKPFAQNIPKVSGHTSRILVVDDNIDTANGLAKFLKLLGHDVRLAYDGETAIEIARDHSPNIVLLDIGLPHRDGYEVVRQLRQESCCKNALIIAVSGYGQEEDLRKSREAGFDHHLVKPVDFAALLPLL